MYTYHSIDPRRVGNKGASRWTCIFSFVLILILPSDDDRFKKQKIGERSREREKNRKTKTLEEMAIMVVRLKVMNSTFNPFSNLFLFIKSSQWLSSEGKYMIEDDVKSRCNLRTRRIEPSQSDRIQFHRDQIIKSKYDHRSSVCCDDLNVHRGLTRSRRFVRFCFFFV